MKKFYISLLFVAVLSNQIAAQSFLRPHEWKKFRRELFFTMGTANFLGDLGGRDRTGTHYSPVDMDLNQSRTAFGVGGRYRIHKHINVSGVFNYLIVRGNDAETKSIYRNNRNLNFKSNVFELSGRLEVGIQRTKRGGGHYGVQKNYARYKNISHNLYGFLGIGVFYFNPYGLTPDGNWVALRNLHTEGQGLPGGPKQYSNYSVCIPMGGYYKFTIKKILSVGVELCYRKTFTDYMDDVGGTYYNRNALAAAYGPLSATMSDPSKGLNDPNSFFHTATSPDGSGNPAQRGNKQKDSYVSLQVTLGYIFKEQRKSARLRSKFWFGLIFLLLLITH